MAFKNYYDTLGIQPTASQDEIKQAYRKLSLKFHPDKTNGDTFLEEMFKSINEANEILSDPEKRKEFDATLQKVNGAFQHSYESSKQKSGNEDLTKLFELIKLYFEKEKKSTTKQSTLFAAKYIPKPQYLTISKALVTVFIMTVIYFIVSPSETTKESKQQNIVAYEWVTIQKTSIYSKPDINSTIITDTTIETGFNSLKETNYFIKVHIKDKSGNQIEGYVPKKHIKKVK